MLVDELPKQPLHSDVIDDIRSETDECRPVFRREGCISFVIRLDDGDGAYIGYHLPDEVLEWRITMQLAQDGIDIIDAIAKHKEIVMDDMVRRYRLDRRFNDHYEYMDKIEGFLKATELRSKQSG
jgi:hypothetical protein